MTPDDLMVECTALARQIVELEKKEEHSRTIVLGDFNLNPFDQGMAAANGLHAVMSKRVALRRTRTVQAREYPFFYNPMWSLLGDGADEVAGTFFYEKAQHLTYFWNTFDQVLIRPELISNFQSDQIRILSTIGTTSLLGRNGKPNVKVGSDHLPLLLDLNF